MTFLIPFTSAFAGILGAGLGIGVLATPLIVVARRHARDGERYEAGLRSPDPRVRDVCARKDQCERLLERLVPVVDRWLADPGTARDALVRLAVDVDSAMSSGRDAAMAHGSLPFALPVWPDPGAET